MKKILLSLLALLALTCLYAEEFQYQPLSSKYIEWLEKNQIKSFGLKSYELGTNGYSPNDYSMLQYTNGAIPSMFDALVTLDVVGEESEEDPESAYGSSFDARNNNWVTPLRTQSPWGTCWAHGSIASCESSYIVENKCSAAKAATIDFSELNLAWKGKTMSNPPEDYEKVTDAYQQYILGSGATYDTCESYCKALLGPVWEADDPYVAPYKTKNSQPYLAAFMKKSASLPTHISYNNPNQYPSTNFQYLEIIKAYVSAYGAAYLGFRPISDGYTDGVYSGGYYWYYSDKKGDEKGGHAVAIIGWDDEVEPSKFIDADALKEEDHLHIEDGNKGKGAWLIKDSNNFYFWMSYFESTINEIHGFVVTANTAKYHSKLETSKGVSVIPYGQGISAKEFKNIYTADNYGYLTGVGVTLSGSSLSDRIPSVSISINGDEKSCSIKDSDKDKALSLLSGYQVFEFKNPIRFEKGDSIECTTTIPDANYLEYGGTIDHLSEPVAGICFARTDSSQDWTDIGILGQTYTGTLYASEYVVGEEVELDETEANLTVGDKLQISGKVLPVGASETQLYFKSEDEEIADFSTKTQEGYNTDGIITGITQGSTKVDVRNIDSDCETSYLDLNVWNPAEELIVSPEEYVFYTGGEKEMEIECSVLPTDTYQDVNFKSNNSATISVEKTDLNKCKVTLLNDRPGKYSIIASTSIKKLDESTGELDYIYKEIPIYVKVPVDKIIMSSSNKDLNVNESTYLTTSVSPVTAEVPTIKWKSSNTKYLTVTDLGNGKCKVSAIKCLKNKPYTVTVTAYTTGLENNVSTTCKINIVSKPTSIEVEDDFSLGVKQTHKISYSLKPNTVQEDYKVVTFTSSNKKVATVNTAGVVTGVASGTAKITIKSKSTGVKAVVNVVVKNVKVTGVKVDPNKVSLLVGDTKLVSAVISPATAQNQNVKWYSTDNSIANVDNNGKITANLNGSCVVYCITEDGKYKATCNVKVTKIAVKSLSFSKYTTKMYYGDTYTFVAKINPTNASFKTVTWSSSNPSVATVDSNGLVTAILGGTTNITATCDGKVKYVKLTVVGYVPVVSVTSKVKSVTIKKGQSKKITVTVNPTTASDKTVTYKSSNTKYATVSNTGVIKGIKVGYAYITVTSKDNPEASVKIKVTIKSK